MAYEDPKQKARDYVNSFSMFGSGGGKPGAGTRSRQAYLGLNGMNNWRTDTAAYGSPGGKGRLLGAAQGNTAWRQGVYLGSDGNPMKIGGVTTATLYEQQSRAGRFGFSSQFTGRYREQKQSMNWKYHLTQSSGPNKAPRGVAQSSVDRTTEMFSTIETRYQVSNRFNRDEEFNEETQIFESRYRGFEELPSGSTEMHYNLDSAIMFNKARQKPEPNKLRSILE